MYHAFCEVPPDDDPHSLFVQRSSLAEQLRHLRVSRWNILDLDHYLHELDRPSARGRQILITIDDGYRSVLQTAAPEFLRAGVRPIVFVPPGLITDTPDVGPANMADQPLMTAAELRELADYGIELGVHGLDHTTMAGMTQEQLRRHTSQARSALADLTGTRARSFAYPLGVVDQRAAEAVQHAGYEVAFSVFDDFGRWGVPRTGIASVDSLSAFRFKLHPWYDLAWKVSAPLAGLRRYVRPALRMLPHTRGGGA
jgi:peptidoglycan/xylan/chitin deacetylase (PgdA/CDA1 family)